MSKSLDFCKKVASDTSRSSYVDRDWNKAVEDIETESIFDELLHGFRNFYIDGTDNEENKIHIDVEIVFNKDADFDYFTSESCIHDGTLVFIKEIMNKCVKKVCGVETYNKNVGQPQMGDTVKYIIGNFIILNEYDEHFAPLNKPWMTERTTVLLPIKMEITR